MQPSLPAVLSDQLRLLAFRPIRPNLSEHFWLYFLFALFITWIVGIGRYWDHPDAEIWQYLGLGSVAYIFVLSAVLYLVVLPLGPANWSYRLVLVFVGFTSLPAALYAVPVERFMDLEKAQSANAWFLGIVATWRVALYIWFLMSAAKLGVFRTIVATILPLTAIVVGLAALNLEHVVFDIMAGIREGQESPNDMAYTVVFTLSVFAFLAFPVTLVCYVAAIVVERRRMRRGGAHRPIRR